MLYPFVFTLLLVLLAVPGSLQTQVQESSVGKSQELFNGRNLKGWYSFLRERGKNSDPKKVFTVKDKVLRVSGEEWGCITTEKEYENYTLTVEFRWGEATFGTRVNRARDSGILIHSQGEDGAYNGVWMHSIEVQLIEGGTGDLLVVGDKTEKFALTSPVAAEKQVSSHVYQRGGRPVTIHGGRINWFGRDAEWKDVKGFRGSSDVEKPQGEWNTLVIRAYGDTVAVYLNGTLVNEAFNLKPSKGRIQIQSEGAEVFFRRVELVGGR